MGPTFEFVFERGSIKNQIGQSEISQNLTRTLVFSVWGTFSKRGKGLKLWIKQLQMGLKSNTPDTAEGGN